MLPERRAGSASCTGAPTGTELPSPIEPEACAVHGSAATFDERERCARPMRPCSLTRLTNGTARPECAPNQATLPSQQSSQEIPALSRPGAPAERRSEWEEPR